MQVGQNLTEAGLACTRCQRWIETGAMDATGSHAEEPCRPSRDGMLLKLPY